MKKEIKIIGSRSGNIDSSRHESNRWLNTISKLRGGRGICERGIYRFRSYEEADQWMKEMMIKSYRESPQ